MWYHVRQCGWPLAVGLLVLAGEVSLVSGQEERKRVEATGVIEGAQAGILKVKTDEGKQIFVKPEGQRPELSFFGTADPRFLQPGMMVQFRCAFDKRLNALEDVRELTVFTPNAKSKLGLINESFDGTGKYFMVGGQLQSFKDDKLHVVASGQLLKCKFAEKARIRVQLAELTFAQPGDKVDLEGWHKEGQDAYVFANQINVTTSRIIGAPPEDPRVARLKQLQDLERDLESLDDPAPRKDAKEKPAEPDATTKKKE